MRRRITHHEQGLRELYGHPRRGRRSGTTNKSVAQHEAGHAVLARVLTLPARMATIEPSYTHGHHGFAMMLDHYTCDAAWERRGKYRGSLDAALHARIITVMAGAEAEMALLGRTSIGGDGNDREQIELMAEELYGTAPWERIEPRLRAMTRMLVRRHWKLIRRVARALLDRKTLTGREIDRLIGRSVDDVKCNAPILKALAAADVARIRSRA